MTGSKMLNRYGRWPLALLLTSLLAACGGDPHGDPVRFTVPAGAGLSAVADTLARRDIIEWPVLFRVYTQVKGFARSLKPGVYELQAGTAWSDILEKLVSGDIVRESLVIPEGWTAAQIGERIAAMAGVPADSVVPLLLDSTEASARTVPGPTLEGYLYPATYILPVGTSAREAIDVMVARYRQVWTPELRAIADSAGLSEREVVTLASIVEKEAKRWTERDTIAGVYRNRLRIGMPLQADPTVQYALGAHQRRLLYSHIRDVADNPYNTYTHAGLPPGPIASPSEGSIRAVLNPADVPYLYFVARPDGSHEFTRSLAEHNTAKNRIRRATTEGATNSR
jgi:UPF0755 protein